MESLKSYEHLIGQLIQCQFLIGLVTQITYDEGNTEVIEVLWCNSDLKDKVGTYLPVIVEGWRETYIKYRGEVYE